jgi:hypothetical protein
MLQIFLNHFLRDIARTPRAISDRPKMVPPVALFQFWKLRLQQSRRPTFQALDQIRQRQFRRILEVHMNMIFAHHARQYSDIFRVADLHQQSSTPHLYIAFQNVIAILRTPHDVRRQARQRVMTVSVIFHLPQFSHRLLRKETKVLRSKRIASTSVLKQ